MYARKGSFWFWVLPPVAVGVVLCALHFGWWQRFTSGQAPPSVPPVAAPAPVPEPQLTPAPVDVPEIIAPPKKTTDTTGEEPEEMPVAPYSTLDEAEGALPTLVGMLSDRPELVSWAMNRPLLVRFAHAVDNVAKGQSPRVQLDFLMPDHGFEAATIAGVLVPAPSSFARYDIVADVFSSLRPEGAAEIYRRVSPILEEIYLSELGYTEGTFRSLLGRACDSLLQTPIPTVPLRLQPGGRVCYFDDPSLERLATAQKHLLRMGPVNATRIQKTLRELASACDVSIQDNSQ